MKLQVVLTAVMATSTVAISDYVNCRTWHPKIMARIEAFCTPSNMVVPSTYAQTGNGNTNIGLIGIEATCKPAQWVPYQYCKVQFQAICGQHLFSRTYGKNGCQNWRIRYAPGAVKPIQGGDGSTWYQPLHKRDAAEARAAAMMEAEPLRKRDPEAYAMALAEALPEERLYKTKEEAEEASLKLGAA